MKTEIDVGILEVLASKICHDLISPVGAVNNGVEILEEMGPEAGKDVTDLIAFSAAQASAKLQVFRLAYGTGGADTNLKPEDVHKAFETLLRADGKIRQEWDPHAGFFPADRPKGFCKLLACVLLLGIECLPKGGTLSVTPGKGGEILVGAAGENAGLKEKTEDALALKSDESVRQPKFIHAYTSGLLARSYGFGLSVAGTGDGFVSFGLVSPAQE